MDGLDGRLRLAVCGPLPQLQHNHQQVHISSLALLKMLKHGRAGVPMEVRPHDSVNSRRQHWTLTTNLSIDHSNQHKQVMGLMLGNFVDDYTVNCIDVFAMPQSGTSVTVEAVDPVFQHKMLEMLKQTGRCVTQTWPRGLDDSAAVASTTGFCFIPPVFLYINRPEMVVGWYHSHPGFGCWLSGVDVNTQQVRACLPACMG